MQTVVGGVMKQTIKAAVFVVATAMLMSGTAWADDDRPGFFQRLFGQDRAEEARREERLRREEQARRDEEMRRDEARLRELERRRDEGMRRDGEYRQDEGIRRDGEHRRDEGMRRDGEKRRDGERRQDGAAASRGQKEGWVDGAPPGQAGRDKAQQARESRGPSRGDSAERRPSGSGDQAGAPAAGEDIRTPEEIREDAARSAAERARRAGDAVAETVERAVGGN